MLSFAYCSRTTTGRIPTGVPKTNLATLQPTLQNGVREMVHALKLGTYVEEQISRDRAREVGLGQQKATRFYIRFVDLQQV